jgi:hypothetical protein
MMRMTTMTGVALLALAAVGCKDEPNPCDSTSYYDGSSCMPKLDAATPPAPDTAPPAAEAGVPSVDTDQGEAASTGVSLLGNPCTDNVTHAECQGPDTDYCAIQPPATVGYCTKTGCVTAADCPTNWTCFDSLKSIGVPAMCAKPKT